MDVSIIIPSFNTRDLLDRCLRSVTQEAAASPFSYEVIVVDNASTDGSVAMMKKKHSNVICVVNKTNVGYGKANNMAIRRAHGARIILLNSDTVALPGSITALYRCSASRPRTFVGGKLFNENGSPQASAGPMVFLPVAIGMLFFQGDRLGITRSSPSQSRRVDWVSGACLCGAKKDFLDVGLFDESIFLYMEEIDFLYRASQKGYTIFFCSEAHFIHTGAASSGNRRTPVVNIYRGLLYFYRKHRSIIEQRILKVLLASKARIAIGAGRVLGQPDLVNTYEEALHMV